MTRSQKDAIAAFASQASVNTKKSQPRRLTGRTRRLALAASDVSAHISRSPSTISDLAIESGAEGSLPPADVA